ncbi:MAG TPA: type III polyketide synthase [Pirellulales bacterium]|jgi:predicted naringenin-chalcone synthase|nr:type III polyketide synthase [Pirellulales bacterium]
MSLLLHAIGTAVPRHFITQEDAAGVAQTICVSSPGQGQAVNRIYQRCGVRTRHSIVLEGSTNGKPAEQAFYVPAKSDCDSGPTTAARMRLYEESAGGLALSAASEALAKAHTAAREVTHLITVSCTGFQSPGVDVALVRQLGLDAGVARTHIGFMGCHAALNALRVAKAFTEADAEACVLVCAVELCSLHYQYGSKLDQIISNALFADGAAAVVARRDAGSPEIGRRGWRLRASASAILPETLDAMGWHVRDHGFQMTLSAKVPGLIQDNLRPWLEKWLGDEGLSFGQIGQWAIHPGGPRILAACGQACGLKEDQLRPSYEVLGNYGNMSSPTILFILQRLDSAAGRCVALAFGPGLTVEAALLD